MSMSEMDKARTTPHESKTRPMPEPNLCAECGLSPWDDIHMTAKQARTAKARQARRRNVLERKADEYAAALRELGYTVLAPGAAVSAEEFDRLLRGVPSACPLCGGVNGHASICDDYGRES